MTNKHPALRLAEMTDVTDRSVIWQKWKQDACEQLRTQHALLERARAALSHSNPSEPIWKTPHREALAALNQHLDQK